MSRVALLVASLMLAGTTLLCPFSALAQPAGPPGSPPPAAPAAPGTAAPAAAAPATGPEATARDLVSQGNKLFEVGRFKEALELYEKAYNLISKPDYLFNMAQCHRELGRLQEAVRLYQLYLVKIPNAADRAEVETEVAALQKRLEAEPKPEVLPRTDAGTPPAGAAPATGGSETPSGSTPWYRRWYVWTVVGVVVTGAVVAGAVAGTRSGDPLTKTFSF